MYPRNAASPERIAVGAVVQISDGAVQTSGVSIAVRGQGGASGAGSGTTVYDNGVVEYTPTQGETDFTSFLVIAYKTGCIPVAVTIVTTASATPGHAGLDWGVMVQKTATNALTNTSIASVSGAVGSVTGAVGSVTGSVGSVTGSVGSVTGNVGGNVVGSVASVTGAVGSVTGNVGGNVTGSVGSVVGNVGGNVTGTVGSIVSPGNIWDVSLAAHLTAGSTGFALNAAGAAGDPWGTALPGAYGAGTAGYIVGTNLNAVIGDVPTALENADALLNRDMSAVTDSAARSPLNALRFLRNKWSISGTTLTVTKENDTTSAWTAVVSTSPGADPVVGNDPA